MSKNNKNERVCMCLRAQMHWRQRLKKDQGKRKRQLLVYNPEEDMYHEPYMKDLRKEFSEISLLCDSKVELPWKDIALPTAGMRIRQDSSNRLRASTESREEEDDKPTKKESTGTMPLPWHDLIISGTVESKGDAESCGSTLEIPWNDLAFDKPCDIQPPEEETCGSDDVEIPWDDIKIPDNVIIECPKKRKHPSSKSYPNDKCPNSMNRSNNCECCAKLRTKNRPPMFCI